MNLATQIEQWVTEAVEKYRMGDQITWAGGYIVQPTQEGLIPAYGMNFIMPSIVLGETIQTLSFMPLTKCTEENVHSGIQETLEALRNQRSLQANLNGSPESSSGKLPSSLLTP